MQLTPKLEEATIAAESITKLKTEDFNNVGKNVQQVINAGGAKKIECIEQENKKWTIRAWPNGNN